MNCMSSSYRFVNSISISMRYEAGWFQPRNKKQFSQKSSVLYNMQRECAITQFSINIQPFSVSSDIIRTIFNFLSDLSIAYKDIMFFTQILWTYKMVSLQKSQTQKKDIVFPPCLLGTANFLLLLELVNLGLCIKSEWLRVGSLSCISHLKIRSD